MTRSRLLKARRWLAALTALALVTVAGLTPATWAATANPLSPAPERSPDTYVAAWDAIGAQAFTAAALTPAEGHTIFAYVAIAVYDSAMAIQEDYKPFTVDAEAPADASAEAAVATAAYRVLAHYLPAQAATILTPAYDTSLASIPADVARDDGVDVGEAVAAALIADRADDGFRAPATYTAPDPPVAGVWIPTGPTPIGPYLGSVRPFALASADQYRPDGPPALASKQWAGDFNEVKEIGSATSPARTAYQTAVARFWGQAPVQQARGSFRKFVLDHDLDIIEAARFMAMVSVTYADALIACFDAKYHYAFWRPVTAIRAGDTDGNDATIGDAAWSPLLGTPNHPEYPSAHSCITPAGGIVISRFLDSEDIDFTVPSLTGTGDRHFDTAKQLREEVGNARVWGGIHFRTAVSDGAMIARKTANFVLARYFKASGD